MDSGLKISLIIGTAVAGLGGLFWFFGGSETKDVPLHPPAATETAEKQPAAESRSKDEKNKSGANPNRTPKRIVREPGTGREGPKKQEIAASTEPPIQTDPAGSSPSQTDSAQSPRSDESQRLDQLLNSAKPALPGDTESPSATNDVGNRSQDSTGSTGAAGLETISTESSAPTSTTGIMGKPEPTIPGTVKRDASVSSSAKTDTVKTYTVAEGDTLAMLAEVHYGSQRFTGYLVGANPQITDPNQVPIGMVLRIPPLGERPSAGADKPLETARANAAGTPTGIKVDDKTKADKPDGKTYVVAEGDTFYAIARKVLGDPARWKELYEFNKATIGNDPSHLRIGDSLRIPETTELAKSR